MPGLSSREAEERIRQGLDNEQVSSSTRTVEQIVKENVFTYFNLIFTVLGVLLVIVGSFKDLTFMLIVVANTAIGIAQEIKMCIRDSLKGCSAENYTFGYVYESHHAHENVGRVPGKTGAELSAHKDDEHSDQSVEEHERLVVKGIFVKVTDVHLSVKIVADQSGAVSYTHLDVYKRQG